MLATSRQLAASFFPQLACGDSYVAVWRLPGCGRAQHGSLPVGPRACRSVSRSQSRCAIASDELRAVVGDDSRLRFRVLLLGSLQNHFDVGFSHGLPEIPMHEETAEPLQNAAQVIEGAAQVDVGNVDMPVLVRLQRLLSGGSLARWFALSLG